MARKKLSPLVEAMNMYASLDDRDRNTLLDWIKSQQPKKQRAKYASPVAKKSSPKGGETKSIQNIPTGLPGVGAAASGD